MCTRSRPITIQVVGPFGPHFIVWTEHAPTVNESERVYALMARVREFDVRMGRRRAW